MSTDEGRPAFMAGLDRQRRSSALRIAVALAAWAAIYGLGHSLWEPKALPYVIAEVLGDLLLLFALAIAFLTPWTKARRDDLWRRRELRMRRTEENS